MSLPNLRQHAHQVIVAAAVIGMLLITSDAKADTLGRQLQKHAPVVIKYLNDNNIKTVGVLKFRIQKPGEKLSDSVGPINSLLADRLEVGLILANPFDPERQLNIIRDASKQVSKIGGANHLNAAGRAAMFAPSYKLAWGEQSVQADAFLTGLVQVDENQRAKIGILCFKRGGKLERVCDVFEADLDAPTLGEMGESFALRGIFDDGKTQPAGAPSDLPDGLSEQDTLVRTEVQKVNRQQSTFPLLDPSSPVQLQVTYDGRAVEIEVRGGKAFIPEPREGQEVKMTLIRNANVKGRIAIVLKVNGENTLYRQTIRDLDCSKWILSPEQTKVVVAGYQMADQKTIETFRVMSQSESAEKAIDYGRSVGQIQVTVFGETTQQRNSTPEKVDDADEDLIAMMRGIQPGNAPGNLNALKNQIRRGKSRVRKKGLIGQGKQKTNQVRTVDFKPNPTPIMAATVTYFTP